MSTSSKRHSRRRESPPAVAPPPSQTATSAAVIAESATNSPFIEAERRHAMICDAAYYLSKRRGFCPGCELDDWLAAEREIDRVLTSGASAVDEGRFE